MNRESGYYWVTVDSTLEDWVIAYYVAETDDWEFNGCTVWNGYFDEIDERKIERQ